MAPLAAGTSPTTIIIFYFICMLSHVCVCVCGMCYVYEVYVEQLNINYSQITHSLQPIHRDSSKRGHPEFIFLGSAISFPQTIPKSKAF